MKNFKKLIAVILAVLMVAAIPMTAFAAQVNENYIGKNLTWTFSESTGELKIIGMGDMTDFSQGSYAPWNEYASQIVAVTLDDGVTSIGNYAFFNCSFTDIVIPNGVKSIGDCAFFACDKLESIVIPDTVKKIGDDAFIHCIRLGNVTLGNGIEHIGDSAFNNCPITSIEIPASVNELGLGVFSSTKLTDICVDPANKAYTTDEYGVLFDKSLTYLLQYPMCNRRTSYEIPYGVKYIHTAAFSSAKSLTSVTIPESVVSIGPSAFSHSGIANIKIPDSVEVISALAFYCCFNLTNATIGNGTVLIETYAFGGCENLTRVTIGSNINVIGREAFFECPNLTIVCFEKSEAREHADYYNINTEFIKAILSEEKLTLKVNEKRTITALPKQEFVKFDYVGWRSSDTSVATVDKYGNITAIDGGNATIHALGKNGETLAECSVTVLPKEIVKPSTTTIRYGNSIILHVDKTMIPDSGYVEWSADNDNFSWSADGETCTISPNKSGSTTFTATIYDAQGNAVSKDEQTMTSKAGFFDKIIAFFKKLFGLTKVIQQSLNTIY